MVYKDKYLEKNASQDIFELIMMSKPSSALLRGLNKSQENVKNGRADTS